MFEHSVKVPRHYKIAANILKKVSTEGGSVKTLLYDDKLKHFRTNVLYALITETIKHAVDIEKIFKSSGILANEPRLDPWLAKVLAAELLFGKKALPGKSKPIQTILSYKEQFETFIPEQQDDIKSKVVHRPRYVRINTNLLATSDAIRAFQDEGYKFIRCTSGSYDDYLQQIQNLSEYDFTQDYHVKTMFVFPPGTKLHEHDLYLENQIILQDKATALAVHLLAPPPGSVILDMCAAPGMKTTQLAAYIRNQGKIYAVERNENRYETLCDFVERTGSKCVETLHKDALEIKRGDCEDVEYILLDPSCSGSGMDLHVHNYIEDSRLARLTSLQEKFLKHAMNSFPNAKRIVYSTCSLLPEENERVITNVVKTSRAKWRVQDIKEILKGQWNNFGSGMYGSMGTRCLYAIPDTDLTIGFFVAVLDRDLKDLEKCREENKCREELNGHHKIKKSKNDNELNDDTRSKVKEEIEEEVKEKRENHKKIKHKDVSSDFTNSFLDVSNKKLEDISLKYEVDNEKKYNGHKTIKTQKNIDENNFEIKIEVPNYCEEEIKQKRKKDKKEKHKDRSNNIEDSQNNTDIILDVKNENNYEVTIKKKKQKRKRESFEDLIDDDNSETKISKNKSKIKQDEISDYTNSFLDVSDIKPEDSEDISLKYKDNNENKLNDHNKKKINKNLDETNIEIKVEASDGCEEEIKRKRNKNKKEKHKDSQNNTEIISDEKNENNDEVTSKKKKQKRKCESFEDLIEDYNNEIKITKNKTICGEDTEDIDIFAMKAKKKKNKDKEQICNDIIIREENSTKMNTKESDVCFGQSYDTNYENTAKSKKKKKKDKIHDLGEDNESVNVVVTVKDIDKKCKKKKRDKVNSELNSEETTINNADIDLNKKRKNKSKHSEITEINPIDEMPTKKMKKGRKSD